MEGFLVRAFLGEDEEVLYEYAEDLKEFLEKDPEVISASVSSTYDSTSAVMDASYEYLSSLGIPNYEAAMTTAILFNGMDTGIFHDPDSGNRNRVIQEGLPDARMMEMTIRGR